MRLHLTLGLAQLKFVLELIQMITLKVIRKYFSFIWQKYEKELMFLNMIVSIPEYPRFSGKLQVFAAKLS